VRSEKENKKEREREYRGERKAAMRREKGNNDMRGKAQ
jgi:hypothetical protein